MSRFDEEPDGDPHGECAAEIGKLKAERDALREALQGLYDDTMDYIRLNDLGGENNHWLVVARAALAQIKEHP